MPKVKTKAVGAVLLSADSRCREEKVSVLRLREVQELVDPKDAPWVRAPAETFTPLVDVLSPIDHGADAGEEETERALGVVFRKAYEEGLEQAQSTIDAMQVRYQQAIAQLSVLRQEILHASETDLVKLSWLIAKEAVLAESDTREEFTLQMVAHALDLLAEADQITLRVSPTDLNVIAEQHPEYLERTSRVRLVEDRTLSIGGVIAQSNIGRVDASLESRLRQIAEKLAPDSTAANDSVQTTVLDAEAVFVEESEEPTATGRSANDDVVNGGKLGTG